MKFEWENNKTASTVIKIAVLLLLVLGILQVFLIKQLGKNIKNTVLYIRALKPCPKKDRAFLFDGGYYET